MKNPKQIFLIIIVLMLFAGFFFFDLGRYLSFEYLKAQQGNLESFYTNQPIVTSLGFLIIYIVVVALSLPGAAIMTLAAGAIFGLIYGSILVSFASTIGASIAFLISRFILRKSIQVKFTDKLKEVNRGIEEEGAMYLFTMRLIPAIPFFVINLVMGLTSMKLKTFYIASQIGMIPGTIVFVNAGTQLAQLESMSGILNPTLIFSFVLLGLFPIIAKKLVLAFKAKK